MPPSALAGAMAPASPFAFPSQLKPLKRDLRADRPFDPDDGKTVSDALSTLGVSDGDLFSSIKKFQKDQGLKVDGWMKPKGPTEKTLNAVFAGGIGAGIPQGKDKADWLSQHALPQDIVGFDFDRGEPGRNAPGDLMKVKRGFGALIPGKLGRLFEDQPDDFGETVDMIKAFQRGAGLKESGWMAPGDETTKAFAAGLKQILPQLADARSEELLAVDPGFLWQRLRGERTPQDKSLFPKGYTNWREMRELGEVGSKRPHLVEALAEKNARSDLDYKIDANFKAERERIGGLTLLRAAEKDHGGEKRTTPEASEEESNEPTDSLAPASESDTLTPVPPGDTTETESKEEAPAEETTWSLDQVPIIEVKDEELKPVFKEVIGAAEGARSQIGYDPLGVPDIGNGVATMVWNTSQQKYVLVRYKFQKAGDPLVEADWASLQTYADALTEWRKNLDDGAAKATAALVALTKTDFATTDPENYGALSTLLVSVSGEKDDFNYNTVRATDQTMVDASATLSELANAEGLTDEDRVALRQMAANLEVRGTDPRQWAEANYPSDSTYQTRLEQTTADDFVYSYMTGNGYDDNVIQAIGEDVYSRLTVKQRAELISAAWNSERYFGSDVTVDGTTATVGEHLRIAIEEDLKAQAEADAKGEEMPCRWQNARMVLNDNPTNPGKGFKNAARNRAAGFSGCPRLE